MRIRVLAALAAVTLVAACGGGSDGGETSSGEGDGSIVLVTGSEIATLDVQLQVDKGSRQLLGEVYEGLYILGDDGPEPRLAESLPTVVDDTHYEIKLKTGVTFSDGTPFNADAVVFSLDRISNPDTGSTVESIGNIASTTKVDDSTVIIETVAPAPFLAEDLSIMVIYKPGDVDFTKAENVVGTGPYKLESFVPGTEAKLVYNDQWRGDEPEVKEVTVRIVPDAGTRIQALQSGEADIVAEPTPTEAKELDNVVATSEPSWSAFVRINSVKGITTDPRVRQALNYAVNKEAIVDQVFGDFARVSQCTPLPNGTGGTGTQMENPYNYDPERAEELLQEAGAEGATLEMTAPTGQVPEDRTVAELVAQDLRAVGLDIKLTYIGVWPDFITVLLSPQEKAPPLTWAPLSDGKRQVSRGLANYYMSNGPASAYNDPEMDELINEAVSNLDQDAAQPVYDELLNKGCDDAVLIYLYDFFELYGLTDNLAWSPGVAAFGGNVKYSDITYK